MADAILVCLFANSYQYGNVGYEFVLTYRILMIQAQQFCHFKKRIPSLTDKLSFN